MASAFFWLNIALGWTFEAKNHGVLSGIQPLKKGQAIVTRCGERAKHSARQMKGADVKALAHDVQNATGSANAGTEDMSCDCSEAAAFLPYCTSGCLRCPKQDTAYYIKNVLSKIIQRYETVLEDAQVSSC